MTSSPASRGLPGIPPRLEVLWPTWTFGWIAGRRTREDEGDRPVVYLGEPIHSVPSTHLANLTSLGHER